MADYYCTACGKQSPCGCETPISRPGDTRVQAQHDETGRFWDGDLRDLPRRYYVYNSETASEYERRAQRRSAD